MPITKDALYGRRAYSKVLDSVFQEAHADTASPHQRDAIGRVAQAWQHLDEIDPHGDQHFDGAVGPLESEIRNAVARVSVSAADPMMAVRQPAEP